LKVEGVVGIFCSSEMNVVTYSWNEVLPLTFESWTWAQSESDLLSIIAININELVVNGSDLTLVSEKSIESVAAWEVFIESERSLVVPLWTSCLDLVTEAGSVAVWEDWWENGNDLNFDDDVGEADLDLWNAGTVALVHVAERVGSIKSEVWLDIMINDDNIFALLALILNVSDALEDLLDSAVQVFHTLLNGLEFALVFIGLTVESVDFNLNWSDLLTDGVTSGDGLVVPVLEDLNVDFKLQVFFLNYRTAAIDVVDILDKGGNADLDLFKSVSFGVPLSSVTSNLSAT
jgi:hypothetical protein